MAQGGDLNQLIYMQVIGADDHQGIDGRRQIGDGIIYHSTARVLGRLVMKGVLDRAQVAALFERAQAAEGTPDLAALAVDGGLLDAERLDLYLRTDGEDVPDLPGFRYLRSTTSVALEALIVRELGSPRRRVGAP